MDIKKLIKEKDTKTYYKTDNGKTVIETKDKVTILSQAEIAGITREMLVAKPSDFAAANYIKIGETLSFSSNNAAYWLRSGENTHEVNSIDVSGLLETKPTNMPVIGLRPRMFLDAAEVIKEIRDSYAFEVSTVTDNIEKTVKHCIEFGEYPQNIVDEELEKELEELFRNPIKAEEAGFEKTGNIYNTSSDKFKGTEYYYAGEKFVRCKIHIYGSKKTIKPASGHTLQDGKIQWFRVEPIVWEILNWESLPKEINPHGTGEAKEVEIVSKDVIIGGMKFYDCNFEEYYGETKDFGKWKYSTIRGYLNGIDVNRTFMSMDGYEKEEYKGGNFTGKGFIDEAFDGVVKEHKLQQQLKKKGKMAEEKTYAFGVKIEEAPLSVKEQMKFYIDNGKSFMLHGPSGVGKTRRVQEIDPDCVMLQLRNGILPEEIIGKTAFEKGKSIWIEPTWYTRIKEICEKDKEHNHVLFIDEITNVHANEQSLVFHIVLEHSIDGNIGKLPDNCVVVAAGNNPEESTAAYNMPEPLFRRFDAHIELQPDIKSFLEWGSEVGKNGRPKIHPLVAAFIAANGEKTFYSKYDEEKPPKFAIDPRGWEQVSNIIYDNNNVLRLKLIADKIGLENATALLQFAAMKRVSIADIMSGDIDRADVPKKKDEMYAFVCSFRMAAETEVKKVREFIKKYLNDELLAFFDNIWIGDNDERALLIDELDNAGFSHGDETEI